MTKEEIIFMLTKDLRDLPPNEAKKYMIGARKFLGDEATEEDVLLIASATVSAENYKIRKN